MGHVGRQVGGLLGLRIGRRGGRGRAACGLGRALGGLTGRGAGRRPTGPRSWWAGSLPRWPAMDAALWGAVVGAAPGVHAATRNIATTPTAGSDNRAGRLLILRSSSSCHRVRAAGTPAGPLLGYSARHPDYRGASRRVPASRLRTVPGMQPRSPRLAGSAQTSIRVQPRLRPPPYTRPRGAAAHRARPDGAAAGAARGEPGPPSRVAGPGEGGAGRPRGLPPSWA